MATITFQQSNIQLATTELNLGEVGIPQVLAPFCAHYSQSTVFPFTYLPKNGVCALPQEEDSWAACICNPRTLAAAWSGDNCQNIQEGRLSTARILIENQCRMLSQATYSQTAIRQTDKNRCISAGNASNYQFVVANESTSRFCEPVPISATCAKPKYDSIQHDYSTYKSKLAAKNLFRQGLLSQGDSQDTDAVYKVFFASTGLMLPCLAQGFSASELQSYDGSQALSKDTTCELAVNWLVPAACRSTEVQFKLVGQNYYLGDDGRNASKNNRPYSDNVSLGNMGYNPVDGIMVNNANPVTNADCQWEIR